MGEDLRLAIKGSTVPLPWVIGSFLALALGGMHLAWRGSAEIAAMSADTVRLRGELVALRERSDEADRQHAAQLVAIQGQRNADAVAVAALRSDQTAIKEGVAEMRLWLRQQPGPR